MESVTASTSPIGGEFGSKTGGGNGEAGRKMVVWWDEKEKGSATIMTTSRRVSVGPMPVFGPAPAPAAPIVFQTQILDPFADPVTANAGAPEEKMELLDNPFDDLLAVDQPNEGGRRTSSDSRVSLVSTSSGRHVVVSVSSSFSARRPMLMNIGSLGTPFERAVGPPKGGPLCTTENQGDSDSRSRQAYLGLAAGL
jgi:hypothetical protein